MVSPVFESVESLTQEEFFEFVRERSRFDDLNELELLNGRVVMTPPAGYPHGAIEGRIVGVLLRQEKGGSAGRVFASSQGFDLPSGDAVAPDASFISRDRLDAASPHPEGRFLRVVPELVVEILSTSTASRDRGEKKAIYERNCIREYWIVDPRALDVLRFTLRGERFDDGRRFATGELFTSELLPELTFPVADLFAS